MPEMSYVTGLSGPEDLVAVPGTNWIITSGLKGKDHPGALWLIERDEMTAKKLFPAETIVTQTHASVDPECNNGNYGIDPATFSAHGLGLRMGRDGTGDLLVMNQDGRGMIEVFGIDVSSGEMGIRWKGCVPLPKGALGNGVTMASDGTIVATLMNTPEYIEGPADAAHPENWVPKLASGQTTGYAATWRPREGWKKIAGTEGSGPNGIEVSPDVSTVWVAMWGNREVVRAPLNGVGKRAVIKTGFMPDNLHWGDDGKLWMAGAAGKGADYFACQAKPGCRNDYVIAQIDPASLKLTTIPHPVTLPTFGEATAVIRLGGDAWIGAHPSDRVAVMPLAR